MSPKRYANACQGAWRAAALKLAASARTAEELAPPRRLYYASVRAQNTARQLEMVNPEAMERAIKDMETTWPGRYQGAQYRTALADFVKKKQILLDRLAQGEGAALTEAEALAATLREALLANPLLDDNQMLVVRRTLNPGQGRRAIGASTGLIGAQLPHQRRHPPHRLGQRDRAGQQPARHPGIQNAFQALGRQDPARSGPGVRRQADHVLQHRRQRPLGDLRSGHRRHRPQTAHAGRPPRRRFLRLLLPPRRPFHHRLHRQLPGPPL